MPVSLQRRAVGGCNLSALACPSPAPPRRDSNTRPRHTSSTPPFLHVPWPPVRQQQPSRLLSPLPSLSPTHPHIYPPPRPPPPPLRDLERLPRPQGRSRIMPTSWPGLGAGTRGHSPPVARLPTLGLDGLTSGTRGGEGRAGEWGGGDPLVSNWRGSDNKGGLLSATPPPEPGGGSETPSDVLRPPAAAGEASRREGGRGRSVREARPSRPEGEERERERASPRPL